ncbi:hypothetical protein Cme02nite_28180 [Catellatospora methionotrophica]|uniref:Uncharacterized protein n=1 Tax=Catellatospora methionotrophica TaxID=121620 RepID=A0A8J3PGN4_9ACTN|nr:hypothetical protein Cme02nite_28180 [Catellatospora methionotrophica]
MRITTPIREDHRCSGAGRAGEQAVISEAEPLCIDGRIPFGKVHEHAVPGGPSWQPHDSGTGRYERRPARKLFGGGRVDVTCVWFAPSDSHTV